MDSTTVGTALARAGVAVVVGLLLFRLACHLSAGEPTRPRDARRVAAWLRATPWLLVVSAATAALGLGLLWFADA